jgi:hypothetical protein
MRRRWTELRSRLRPTVIDLIVSRRDWLVGLVVLVGAAPCRVAAQPAGRRIGVLVPG